MSKVLDKVSDTQLQKNVLAELNWQPSLDAADIGVTVDDGVVTLTGMVASYPQKAAAVRAVRALHSVRGVANDLTVRLPGHVTQTDADIAQAALYALDWDVVVPSKDIKVTVENGHLTLDGTVEWDYQRRSAKRAVEYLSGVTWVTNNIKVEPKVKSTDVREEIRQAFERNAKIEANAINIAVDGSVVTLSGEVDDWEEANAANKAARAAPGVSKVIGHITIPWD